MVVNGRFLNALQQNEMFSGVRREQLSALLTDAQVDFVSYARDDVICSAETYRNAIGFLLRGEAKVQRRSGALMISRLHAGDVFGCAFLFSGESFPGEIVACRQSVVAYISKTAVVRLMELDGGFTISFIRYLSQRIFFLSQRIDSFTGGSAESRLANYLLLCFGAYRTYQLDRSMSQLAVSLDIGRASLYRAFDALEEAGAVRRDGKNVRLADREALASFANSIS